MNSSTTFFIAGCQRSGTTLLRLILDSHSEIHCFDEIEGYKILTTLHLEHAEDRQIGKLVGFKIPRFTEQLLWDKMSDIDYGIFPSFYIGSPVIFLVRDYRDVVHSMIKLSYSDGESWLIKYGRKILMHQAMQANFDADNRKILATVEAMGFRDHMVGALYWKFKTDSLFTLMNSGMPVIETAYDRIVNNPEYELARLLNFLGIQWEDNLLRHYEVDHTEIDDDGLAIGGTDPKLPIHRKAINSYQSFFSQQELKEMNCIVSDTLDKLSSINIIFHNVTQ